MLYFYFDFNDPAKRQPENLVRSLIDQLSSRCAQMPPGLESLYSSCTNGKRQPQASELFKTLHDMMGGFTQTYVVLDALDECLERTKLLSQLEQAKMQEQVSSSLRSMSELAAPGTTPSLDEVRDKIEKRYSTALGQAELAQNSVQGRMLEVQQSSVDYAGQNRLDQIRASMRPAGQVDTSKAAGQVGPGQAAPTAAPTQQNPTPQQN